MLKAILEIYPGRGPQRHRFRVKSRANGKKISVSSEGYARKAGVVRCIELTAYAAMEWLVRNHPKRAINVMDNLPPTNEWLEMEKPDGE